MTSTSPAVNAKLPRGGAAAKPDRSVAGRIQPMAVPPSQFGSRLRHARLTKGMSLRRLSELAGCTESFLSKVENEKANPSLTMLHRIVAVLEINTAALFSQRDASAGPVAVMHAGERPLIKIDPVRRGPGIQLERLIANPAALLQANIHRVAAKGSTEGSIQHDGEELGYVISGELDLTVDGVTQRIGAGDSFFFHSKLPHGYRNPGTQEAVVVWVNTPPTF